MAANEPVVLYGAKDHVARVTLNRAATRNALSPRVVRELGAALSRAGADPDAHVVVLTGAGEQAFATGDATPAGDAAAHEGPGSFPDLCRTLRGLGKPVIARVDGECHADGLALAAALADRSPNALRLGRDAFYAMADLEIDAALAYLETMLAKVLETEDAAEGLAARAETRPPVWTGH